jgi:hypothetical protein
VRFLTFGIDLALTTDQDGGGHDDDPNLGASTSRGNLHASSSFGT